MDDLERRKFYAQVVLVYLQLFWRDSLLKCVAVRNRKNLLKSPIFGLRIIYGHRC